MLESTSRDIRWWRHQMETSHYQNQCWNIVNSNVSNKLQSLTQRKMPLKMGSRKWQPFCLGLNVLKPSAKWLSIRWMAIWYVSSKESVYQFPPPPPHTHTHTLTHTQFSSWHRKKFSQCSEKEITNPASGAVLQIYYGKNARKYADINILTIKWSAKAMGHTVIEAIVTTWTTKIPCTRSQIRFNNCWCVVLSNSKLCGILIELPDNSYFNKSVMQHT